MAEARRRGEEYLLERRLFRRKSTGEVIDPELAAVLVPDWWHYDVLRGLEYLRDAGVAPDERCRGDRGRRGPAAPDGRWPLETVHQGETHFEIDDGEGKPSRWNTLRALRVLDWWRQRTGKGSPP